MEPFLLVLLLALLCLALGAGYPVALAIPGAAIMSIAVAALAGQLLADDPNAYFVHGGTPGEWLSAGVTNLRRIYRSDESDVLIAIPLFIFMGLMLQRSKIAEDLLLAMSQLFRSFRGGLGISVVLVGALLAATTSVIGATVVAMGMISLPTMLRTNYSKQMATGIVAATGTLGQIVPPSIVLIILNHQLTSAVYKANQERQSLYKVASGELMMPSEFDVASASVSDMFMGALVPGLLLVGLYILYQVVVAAIRPDMAPASNLPRADARRLVGRTLLALFPPLTLILLVLGSIMSGVATVNQAGAIGAAGATVMAGYRLCEGERRAYWPVLLAALATCAIWIVISLFDVNLRKIESAQNVLGVTLAGIASAVLVYAVGWSGWRTLKKDRTLKYVVEETTKTTAMVFAILLGAVMLTAAFRAFGGEALVKDFLASIPGGFWNKFAVVMLVIFILGFFLDFIEITVVVVPIIAPIILADPAANVSALWLGVMLALVIQTSFLTPPFGFALFYLRGVTPPSIKTTEIYKGVIPFIALQLVAVGLVFIFPVLVNYLPNRSLLLSEYAPPTTNPRLQVCMENFVARKFESDGAEIRSAIERMRRADLSTLPEELRVDFRRGLTAAERAFAIMQNIKQGYVEVAEAAVSYRPVLSRVRGVESDIRRIDDAVSKLNIAITQSQRAETEEELNDLRDDRARLKIRREELMAQIPTEWSAMHEEFSSVLERENNARKIFRRSVDDAYQPVKTAMILLADTGRLKNAAPQFRGLSLLVQSGMATSTVDDINKAIASLAEISGTSQIRSQLYKVKREFKNESPDANWAREGMAKAVVLFEKEVTWREGAIDQLRPQIEEYDRAIADTIGLRGQTRLPDNIAEEIAVCISNRRDISLHF